jgi:hypothetical protein
LHRALQRGPHHLGYRIWGLASRPQSRGSRASPE